MEARIGVPIDSHKPLLRQLNYAKNINNKHRRSNILTHSENGLDAHRLRTCSPDLLLNGLGYHWLPDNRSQGYPARDSQPAVSRYSLSAVSRYSLSGCPGTPRQARLGTPRQASQGTPRQGQARKGTPRQGQARTGYS